MKTFGPNPSASGEPVGLRPNLLQRVPYALSEGFTESQRQVDSCVQGFVRQSTDLKTLAPLVAGGLAYRLGRMGVMGFGSENMVRTLSVGAGLTAEVLTFEIAQRGLASGSSPLWKWNGRQGLREGLLSSLVTFGTLKGFGRLTQGQNLIVQHGAQATAMVLGHQLVDRAGIGFKSTGSLAEQFVHAEAANLQLSLGMALTHSLSLGRLQGIERGLELSLRQKTFPQNPIFPDAKQGPLSFAFETPGPPVEKDRENFSTPLFMNGSKMEGAGLKAFDELWTLQIQEKFPDLRKELKRFTATGEEKKSLLQKIVQTVRQDSQYSSESKLGESFETEFDQGLELAAQGLTAALKALRKIRLSPEEKLYLLRLFAESDKKFPQLTFVESAYRNLPDLFSAMGDAGWDLSTQWNFLQRLAREISPIALNTLPTSIQRLHRLGWNHQEQSRLYFSWAQHSGEGTETIQAFSKSVEVFTSLGWSKEHITERLSYLFGKAFFWEGEKKSVDYTDYFCELIHRSVLNLEEAQWTSDEISQVLELAFERSESQGLDVFKVLLSLEWGEKLGFDKEQSRSFLIALIQHQKTLEGHFDSLDYLGKMDFSKEQTHGILLKFAEGPDFNTDLRHLPDFLFQVKAMKWTREQRFKILTHLIEKSGEDFKMVLKEVLPTIFAGLQKSPWDSERRYHFLLSALEGGGDIPSRLKQEAVSLSLLGLTPSKSPSQH